MFDGGDHLVDIMRTCRDGVWTQVHVACHGSMEKHNVSRNEIPSAHHRLETSATLGDRTDLPIE